MTLCNDTLSEFASYPRLDLPPLQDPNIFKSSGRPSPLEPDASTRSTNHATLASQPTTAFELDFPNNSLNTRHDGKETAKTALTDRALGGSSPQSLRKILDDDLNVGQAPLVKKRQRAENSKDDFVQLPQPPKKQRAAKQAVPPIIIGLFEPPPNAALFPPIASSAFHDSHGRNSLNIAPPLQSKDEPPKKAAIDLGTADQLPVKTKKAVVQPRNKWTKEETNKLLLGVARHGIGAWTNILKDAEFKFNGRTTVDLKDRWRICCPKEFRMKDSKNAPRHESGRKSLGNAKSSGYLLEDILAGSGEDSCNDEKESLATQKPAPKSRAHRRNLEDLVELGIKEPLKKSQRRERRPFSDEEDQNIIQGFKEFGNAWSLIQKDARFRLQDRRPTDLRDRLRNKYPKLYSSDPADRKLQRDVGNGIEKDHTNVSPPSSQSPETSSGQEKQQHGEAVGSLEVKGCGRTSAQPPNTSYTFPSSFTELLGGQTAIEQPDTLSFSQGFEWGDTSFGGNMGEMDISRLLLDEDTSWHTTTSNMYSKQKYTDINSLCTSITNQYPPGYAMGTFESMQTTDSSSREPGASTE
jgi:hypothetical protein